MSPVCGEFQLLLSRAEVQVLVNAHRAEGDNARSGWLEALLTAVPVEQADGEVTEDTRLLDAIFQNSWDLRCFDMPTGSGDADIGWKVIEHTRAHGEVEIAVAYKDDPREAIREALLATAPEVPRDAGNAEMGS